MALAKYERRILKQKLKDREGKREPKNLKKTNYLIVGLIVLLVSFLGYTFTGYSVGKNNNDFAKCLSDKGAKFYGTYLCEKCNEQKELFRSSAQYVNYVECDPNGQDADPSVCLEKKIEAYPTWEIGRKLYLGVQSLEKLSDLTGCKL